MEIFGHSSIAVTLEIPLIPNYGIGAIGRSNEMALRATMSLCESGVSLLLGSRTLQMGAVADQLATTLTFVKLPATNT